MSPVEIRQDGHQSQIEVSQPKSVSGFSQSSGKRTQVHRVGEGNFSNLSLKAINKGGYQHITT